MSLPPFSCRVSPEFAHLLQELGCTLAISTYQAGKVVLLGTNPQGQMVQLPRNYIKAMGIALNGKRMAIATKENVEVLSHEEALAKNHPQRPGFYDTLYVPRATYYTGFVDIHDLHWGHAGLWAVNTSFSCLSLIDDNYSFTPRWQPFFIDALEHDDYCHLNGMAMQNGEPAYVSALGQTTTPRGWKENITRGGILMNVPENKVVAEGLAMPHSPKIWDGELYLLLSASGELIRMNPNTGRYDVLCETGTFVRGMARHGDYVFIGKSKLRESSTSFKKLQALPIGEKSRFAGIMAVHLPTGRIIGEMDYENSVEEIYDVQVLTGLRRVGILNTENPLHTFSLSIPGRTYWANPDAEKNAPEKK